MFPSAQATMPTFDAINAALQELQNSILNSSFAQDLMLAAERLNQLKTQTPGAIPVSRGIR